MPYDLEHPQAVIDNVHRELQFLTLSLYNQDALPEYRLMQEVTRLYEIHYRMQPHLGFHDRSVDCDHVSSEDAHART